MCSLKCEYISSYGQRKDNFFLKTAHWYGPNFLDGDVFIRPKNLKTSLKIYPQTFLREKVSIFAMSKSYMYTFWLLISLSYMPKGLVT